MENVEPSRLVGSSDSSPSEISVTDYLLLLKSLSIDLPSGVLNPKVIRLSQQNGIIQKAQDIVEELENFKLHFKKVPRLGCHEIKKSLSLKDKKNVFEITTMIFFEKIKDSGEKLKAQWLNNASNTNCVFTFKDKYKTTPISTPAMYATAQTRSWTHVEVGDDVAYISAGVTVNVHDIENREYCDESELWRNSSPQRSGKYFQNLASKLECLSFYHELREIGTDSRVSYTKDSKIDFRFLSGRVEFLMEVKGEKCEKIVIKCKETTGDMVDKVFTKPEKGCLAKLNETHDNCYQVQGYMYILNRAAKQTQSFTSDRAVMVIRHYHKNARESRDFYWNYLRKNEEIQQEIDELRVFCEEEVLACFLAVLNLIFQMRKSEAEGQCNDVVLQKDIATEKRFAEGPQVDASYKLSESGSGHRSVKFLPKTAQPFGVVGSSDSSPSEISVTDYLLLLKSLYIDLPSGVLNPKVIRLSEDNGIIQKAQDIVEELENFKLQFNSIPRLGCREIKKSLSLKDNKNILEITMMIFFEKIKDSEEKVKAQWGNNVSNTKCGFKFREKYKTTPISTPAMYATAQTRSWKHVEVGDDVANISAGVTVNVCDIENREYCDESELWRTSSIQNFGKYFQNSADELECLSFFHKLRVIGTDRVSYTKDNKVDFGFLSGRLDFLVKVKGEKCEKMVIECKGTTGDMVDKVFTKPEKGRCATLIETHEYCYQVQGYMYILNRAAKQTQSFTSDRAVMVIRHYHKNGQEPRDFYWNYLRKNEEIQQKIDELRVFCEEEVLACFLAVLNLIFQKNT